MAGARNYALSFYKSKAWKVASTNYRRQHPFCERCLAKGIFEKADLVHHKVFLNETNWNDPNVSMNPDNFESLCRKCHAEMHYKKESNQLGPDGRLLL